MAIDPRLDVFKKTEILSRLEAENLNHRLSLPDVDLFYEHIRKLFRTKNLDGQ